MLMCLLQVLDELKQTELGNSDREEKIQVKKKTIDLLPDADDNLLKLQVGTSRGRRLVVESSFGERCVCPSRLRWRPVPSGW